MSRLDASYFKRGDIVTASLGEFRVHGRVLGSVGPSMYREYIPLFEQNRHDRVGPLIPPSDKSLKDEVRIALNQPFHSDIIWLPRFHHAGMPTYGDFRSQRVRLEAHDPEWNPFDIRPYSSAQVNRAFYSYLTGGYYGAGDPVWAWEEDDWRPATVVAVDRWISVRYGNGFRDRRGNSAKSYRTWQISPVISETSAIFRKHMEGLEARARFRSSPSTVKR